MCSELLRCRMSSWLQVDHDAQVLAKPFVGYAFESVSAHVLGVAYGPKAATSMTAG